jgi:aryl-alcohol dehydrogenase-like predicted oxidoreductase
LSNRQVSTTIAGMRSLDHVRSNVALSDGAGLKPDLLQRLRQHRWDRDVATWAS